MGKFITTTTIGFSINYGIDGTATVKDENASYKQENMFKALSYGNINALQQLVCLYTTLDLSEEERVKLLTLYTDNLNDLDAQEGIFSYYLNKQGLQSNDNKTAETSEGIKQPKYELPYKTSAASEKGIKQPKYELPFPVKGKSINTASETKGIKQPKYELPYSADKDKDGKKGKSSATFKGSKHPKYELPYEIKKGENAKEKLKETDDDTLNGDDIFKEFTYNEDILKKFFKGLKSNISFNADGNDDNDIEEEEERLGLIFPKVGEKKDFSEYAAIAKANVSQAIRYDDNHITVYNSTWDEMEKAVLILSYLRKDYGFDLAIELVGKYYPIVWFKFKKSEFDIEKLVENWSLDYESDDEKDKNLFMIIDTLREEEEDGED